MELPNETNIKTASLPDTSVFQSFKFQEKKKNKFSSTNCSLLKFHPNAALKKQQKNWATELQMAV